MSDEKDKGVLSRWSERKRSAVLEEQEEPIASPEILEVEASEHEALLQANCEEAESIDLDTIDENSDLSIFMKEGVPELLKRQALSKLWKSNPIFANIDGLNDYDEDFGAESLIMKTFKSAYKVGSGYAKEVIEEAEELPIAAAVEENESEAVISDEDDAELAGIEGENDEISEDGEEAEELANPDNELEEVYADNEVEQAPLKKVSLRQRLSLDG